MQEFILSAVVFQVLAGTTMFVCAAADGLRRAPRRLALWMAPAPAVAVMPESVYDRQEAEVESIYSRAA